jgi:N-acetylmuramoyl-L-alanine amidase
MKNWSSILKLVLAVIPLVLMVSVQDFYGPNLAAGDKAVIKTVVIDAGHGGKDPGCHGASAHEKNVCLSMALKLGKYIKEKYPNVKVIYTRDKDVFVELDERAKIANKSNADLFICIHANSASPTAYGTETYVLGLHRADAQAKVAERENAVINFEDDKGEKYKAYEMSPDAIIARQLQLSVFLDHSINFATKLQSEFKALGRHDRGVRQAGFLVLYKTTMPSVLIETGFLTNPEEEKFLADTASHTKMATAMFTAFEKYKCELEGVEYKAEKSKDNKEVPEKTPEKIVDKNDEGSKTNEIDKTAVYFKVQIETSEKKIALNSLRFKGLNVEEYTQDNLYKYTVGAYKNDFKSANAYKNEMREKGFSNAFVVAFQNGVRINLEKALKLAEK